MFTVKQFYEKPVLQRCTPGTEDNEYGFEGGTVVKQDGIYHLFTSEMAGSPMWVKMRLAHWTSEDRIHFKRRSTLYTSSGNYDGSDPRAALWSPMPTFDEKINRWTVTYVSYRCAPDQPDRMLINHEGKIWRGVSTVEGRSGIGGPYEDDRILMQPGDDSDSWEGLQGTDSFYPYEKDGEWYTFYGSAHTQTIPIPWWGVGLAKAPQLSGPWERCSELNPVLMHDKFVENPIVTRLPDGQYVAVYDGGPKDLGGEGAFGYALSDDGIHWSQGRYIRFDPAKVTWQKHIRTPLCLIPEENGEFTVYYTAMDETMYGCIGYLTLVAERAKE